MVINRGDIKRKRKDDDSGSIILDDDSPKRTKVHAQRKFAQGSNVSSPVITPVKEIEKQEKTKSDVLPEPVELLPIKRPNTEDFLTFLCFRGTPILPPNLNFFNTASDFDTGAQNQEPKEEIRNGPIAASTIVRATSGGGSSERPFIAFGVRKRADPIVISKQMDKKRRHALTLQALRRKYEEQKMAKIRAVTISKLSEKVHNKSSSIRTTRSISKNDEVTKESVSQKTKVKVISTKHVKVTTKGSKIPLKTKIKPKMCLRSFRGRFVQCELQYKAVKKRTLPSTKVLVKKTKIKTIPASKKKGESMSDFSSDDDQPLVETVKQVKTVLKTGLGKIKIAKKSASLVPKKPAEINFRITRSNHLLGVLPLRRQQLKQKLFLVKMPPPRITRSTQKLNNLKKIKAKTALRLQKDKQKQAENGKEVSHIEMKLEKKDLRHIEKDVSKQNIEKDRKLDNLQVKLERRDLRRDRKLIQEEQPKTQTVPEKIAKKLDKKEIKIELKDIKEKANMKIVELVKTDKKNLRVEKNDTKQEKKVEKQNKKDVKTEKLDKKDAKIEKQDKKDVKEEKHDKKDLKVEKQENKDKKLDKQEKKYVKIDKQEKKDVKVDKQEKKDVKIDKEEKKNLKVDKQENKDMKVVEKRDVKVEKQEKKEMKAQNQETKQKEEKAAKQKVDSILETKPKEEKVAKSKVDLRFETKQKEEKVIKQKVDLKQDETKNDEEKVIAKKVVQKEGKETKQEELKIPQRPTRKTKEAAAIYMEILGHKLVHEGDDDDDSESFDSFPELPNVRKTEQRENELKAKAKSKTPDKKVLNVDKTKSKTNTTTKLKEDSPPDKIKPKEDQTENAIKVNKETAKTIKLSNVKPVVSIEKKVFDHLLKDNNLKETEKQKTDDKDKQNLKQNKKSSDTEELIEKTRALKKAVPEIIIEPIEERSEGFKKETVPKRQTRICQNKCVSESDSDESFHADVKIPRLQRKSIRNKRPKSYKSFSDSESTTETSRNEKKIKSTPREESESDEERSTTSEMAKKIESKTKLDKDKASKHLKVENSFSDSDEEPLSKLTQNKKADDVSKKKSEESKPLILEKKPKRECTKRPQNYMACLFSSSDDDDSKYFLGFVKKDTKTSKTAKSLESKCSHLIPSADLLCKDVGRRFGKGKVNMSNEQIEKWLKDSAMAGTSSINKENDEMLKFGEKIPTETSPDINTNSSSKEILKTPLEVQECSKNTNTPKSDKKLTENVVKTKNDSANSSFEKPKPQQLTSDRKLIFRKEKKASTPNKNAFSANNESSVYAFGEENEDIISTPFRRPSRRPSSTATSRSEEESSKVDDSLKHGATFRVPVIRTENLKHDKQEGHHSSSIAVQVNMEMDESGDNTNVECSTRSISESVDQVCVPIQTKKLVEIEQKKAVTKTKLQSHHKVEEKPTISTPMCPPANKLLKSFTTVRPSEAAEEAKYKIPSSPSASSSSSAKIYKRTVCKPRVRPLELCIPVNASDFPTAREQAQMVEAPVFYPNEKEFQDPIEYIDKIRKIAERYGICRIVPPATFKPECKVTDDMRFTAYNQYVHKMLRRWGPNFKELIAIKKYLETQNITFTHPPWIGGMEIDLPRLYQTVQNFGGLKEVIEKKKWPKVSEAMKIPKSAQDRVTKLDDIYCKYLLPYDTLSPAEREKLFDEVETDWAKRESRTLLKAQQKIVQDETTSEVESSESDDEAEECIVKGRSMALNAFYRIARNTMSMWFKSTEPTAQQVEQEFWKHVMLQQNHICVHSGSIDSGNWGYGFAVSKNSPFARHAWNLKVMTNNSGSVLRSMGPIMGVTVPTLHVGMVFSACCWYRDPHGLPWTEYLHAGANKIWYGIPDSMSEVFRAAVIKLVPNYCRNKGLWLPSDTAMVPPSLLVENGVSLCRTVQEPGQFVVIFPKAFTSSISTGYVVSESVYFAPPYWLNTARKVFDELRNSCEPSMFSLDRLIISISVDARSNVEVLKQIIPAIEGLCAREKKNRDKLKELGVTATERLPLPEGPGGRKRKKLQGDEGDYECEICRTNLFVSLVTESQEDGVYCLEHAIEKIEKNEVQSKHAKIMFTYSDEELHGLIGRLKISIENKLYKKAPGKFAGMPTLLK